MLSSALDKRSIRKPAKNPLNLLPRKPFLVRIRVAVRDILEEGQRDLVSFTLNGQLRCVNGLAAVGRDRGALKTRFGVLLLRFVASILAPSTKKIV